MRVGLEHMQGISLEMTCTLQVGLEIEYNIVLSQKLVTHLYSTHVLAGAHVGGSFLYIYIHLYTCIDIDIVKHRLCHKFEEL